MDRTSHFYALLGRRKGDEQAIAAILAHDERPDRHVAVDRRRVVEAEKQARLDKARAVLFSSARPASQSLRRDTPTQSQASRAVHPFTAETLRVIASIDKMQRLLHTQRDDYLDVARHFETTASSMSEEERDELEVMVLKFAQECSREVDGLEAAVQQARDELVVSGDVHGLDDLLEHQECQVRYLHGRVKELADEMSELRHVRETRRQEEELKLGGGAFEFAQMNRPLYGTDLEYDENERQNGQGQADDGRIGSRETLDELFGTRLTGGPEEDDGLQDDGAWGEELELDEAEVAQLQEENESLLEDLQGELDAVRKSQARMVEISQLMSLFSNKLAEQDEAIVPVIADNVIESTAHIQSGNEYLRRAMSRGVTFRVMMMMVLVGAGLSLLFLDHMYD